MRNRLVLSTALMTLAKQPATIVYANRAIVEFRADLLMRTPAERSAAAVRYLDRLVAEAPFARVLAAAQPPAQSGSSAGESSKTVIYPVHAWLPVFGADLTLPGQIPPGSEADSPASGPADLTCARTTR